MDKSMKEGVESCNTAAFINSSVSSHVASGLPQERFVKAEPASPVRDTTDVHSSPVEEIKCEPSLEMFFNTEDSPAGHSRQVEERSISPPVEEIRCEPSLEMFFNTEDSPAGHSRQVKKRSISPPVKKGPKKRKIQHPLRQKVKVILYDDKEFKEHFRMSRETVANLDRMFTESNYFKAGSGQFGSISSLNQVLIFLWFAGHQTASFRDVADRFKITISSLHRIIRRLSVFLSNLSPQTILWPTVEERQASENHFASKGFPGMIGAIGCAHIKIDKPENDPDSYVNRKGYFSVQIQAVCDERRRFIDVFIGYPGSVPGSTILRNSPLFSSLPDRCGPFCILGDGGYPLLNNLLTPYKDRGQLTNIEINYNAKLSQNRYIIEHTFGMLKEKFRQLYHVKLRSIPYIVHFIRACCVLHNMSIDEDFEAEQVSGDVDNSPNQLSEGSVDRCKAIRDRIARTLYSL